MVKSVLVVGCGVFGLSTALDLARKGYVVTAIDAYEPPSPWSAATDYNKIIRTEYSQACYAKLSIEALHLWRSDPLFKKVYNECGRCMVTPSSHKERREFENKAMATLNALGEGLKVKLYQGGDKLGKDFNFFRYNSLPESSRSCFNPESGIAHSAKASVAVYEACKKLGVQFVFGDAGKAIRVTAVEGIAQIQCEDGSVYSGNQILVACGAATGVILDLCNQQSASCLFVTHIQLTSEEYECYKNMPVLFDAEMGYFFPPDPDTMKVKIALPGVGASNFVDNPHQKDFKISLPRYKNMNPEDTIPENGIREVKKILGRYCPELAYHTLINHKTCWIADTQDSHFIVDRVPRYQNLYVATGDSGHGFKFLPNIGKYISAKLEGVLENELDLLWKWRPRSSLFDPTECDWKVVKNFPDLKEIKWVLDEVHSQATSRTSSINNDL